MFFAELQEISEDSQTKFKAERQSRRQLEVKVTVLEEELADLKAEKENLEKVCPRYQPIGGDAVFHMAAGKQPSVLACRHLRWGEL